MDSQLSPKGVSPGTFSSMICADRPRNLSLNLNDSILHLISVTRLKVRVNRYQFAIRHGMKVLVKLEGRLFVLDAGRDGRAFETRVTGEILGESLFGAT